MKAHIFFIFAVTLAAARGASADVGGTIKFLDGHEESFTGVRGCIAYTHLNGGSPTGSFPVAESGFNRPVPFGKILSLTILKGDKYRGNLSAIGNAKVELVTTAGREFQLDYKMLLSFDVLPPPPDSDKKYRTHYFARDGKPSIKRIVFNNPNEPLMTPDKIKKNPEVTGTIQYEGGTVAFHDLHRVHCKLKGEWRSPYKGWPVPSEGEAGLIPFSDLKKIEVTKGGKYRGNLAAAGDAVARITLTDGTKSDVAYEALLGVDISWFDVMTNDVRKASAWFAIDAVPQLKSIAFDD